MTFRREGMPMKLVRAMATVVMVSGAACSPATRLGAQGNPPGAPGDTVPPGFGSLRRDDIVLRFATDQLQLQILPLDERVIRLLAPDTYRSLEQLISSRQRDITDAASRAGLTGWTLVMVTFYGQVPGARFTPEDVQITTRGQLFRPAAIVPLSPTWNTLQLDQKQQAVGLYLYDAGISWFEELSASYQDSPQVPWSRSLQLLQRERARVQARAQTPPAQQNP
jgi:hypothetical protein